MGAGQGDPLWCHQPCLIFCSVLFFSETSWMAPSKGGSPALTLVAAVRHLIGAGKGQCFLPSRMSPGFSASLYTMGHVLVPRIISQSPSLAKSLCTGFVSPALQL